MKINKIKINSYGKIKDQEIEFDKNINIVYGKNESGKSTILKFITNILYGISKNKNGREYSDFDKYKPWDSEDFSGKILFFNCSVNEIYNILVNQSNPNINTFTNKIISKYEFPQDFYNSDVKFLKDLSSYIKTQIPVDKQHLKLSERLLLNLSNRINAELKFHP